MSGTVDINIKRTLLAVMAAATLAVVLAVPMHAQAATDCSAAGTDPTAAQYCPPTEPPKECEENESGSGGGNPISGDNSGSNSGSGSANSEECSHEEEAATAASEPATPSQLPFTGVDILALLAVAGAFIAVGLALQRLSRVNVDHS